MMTAPYHLFGTTPTLSTEILGGIIVALGTLLLISYIVGALVLGKIFKKANIASWKAWVPGYNSWIILEMGRQPGWWVLVALIPYIGLVAIIVFYIALYHIGNRFGKSGWFVLLAIFVPFVWMLWLAFDSSRWRPDRSKIPPFKSQLSDSIKKG